MKSSERHHCGDTREDGRLFWSYRKVDGRTYETWLPPMVFQKRMAEMNRRSRIRYEKKRTARLLWKQQNPPTPKSPVPDCLKPTDLKYLDRRSDGFIFLGYHWRNGKWDPHWASPDRFERWKDQARKYGLKKSMERSKSPELLKRHAKQEAVSRLDPEYKQKQTKLKNRWTKMRCETDPAFKILKNYRKRLWDALNGISKSAKTQELLGASADFLRGYIESKFTEGMTWDNYGEWHVDHVKPCSSFDFNDPSQQRACFHYTNLQPLWAHANRVKSDYL